MPAILSANNPRGEAGRVHLHSYLPCEFTVGASAPAPSGAERPSRASEGDARGGYRERARGASEALPLKAIESPLIRQPEYSNILSPLSLSLSPSFVCSRAGRAVAASCRPPEHGRDLVLNYLRTIAVSSRATVCTVSLLSLGSNYSDENLWPRMRRGN